MSGQVWVTDQRYELLGTTLRVLSQSEVLSGELSRVMRPFPAVSTPARARNIIQVTGDDDGPYTVYHDCARLAEQASRPVAAAAIVGGMNRGAIAQCPHFAVHSGVAAWPGGIVALPAESGQGKTTLTASLVKLGFGFVSDEALVLDDEGRVVPYPKPFALSPWSAEMLGVPASDGETLAVAPDLGGAVATGGPLTDVVVSEYGHGTTDLEPLPRSQAVAALIQYSFNHYKDPERAFRLVSGVARELNVWQLRYDDPTEAAKLLSDTLR